MDSLLKVSTQCTKLDITFVADIGGKNYIHTCVAQRFLFSKLTIVTS